MLAAIGLVPISTPRAGAATAPGGWVLDGWGGLHRFGSAPAVTGGAYWPGWDIARGVGVNDSGPGGWVLDGWGGLHPFGGAPAVTGGGGSRVGTSRGGSWSTTPVRVVGCWTAGVGCIRLAVRRR